MQRGVLSSEDTASTVQGGHGFLVSGIPVRICIEAELRAGGADVTASFRASGPWDPSEDWGCAGSGSLWMEQEGGRAEAGNLGSEDVKE